MLVWGIASFFCTASLWVGIADVGARAASKQPSPSIQVRPNGPPPDFDDANVHITAEDVLKALRKRRPSHRIIEPASGRGRRLPVKKPLWPEGASMVDQTGWVEHEGRWWVFHPEPTGEIPSLKLLANATLEGIVRTAEGASEPVYFQVTGEFTVFQDENYLLPRFATRLRQRPSQPQKKEPAPTNGAAPQSDEASNVSPSTTVATDAPTEDVLDVLISKMPARRPVSADHRRTFPSGKTGIAAKHQVLPDGSPLLDRPGRLSADVEGWVFVFESDQPNYPEPPMKLLLNTNAELMVEAFARRTTGLVFQVSGEVTTFEGRNYLLPRIARRRIDSGNLRK